MRRVVEEALGYFGVDLGVGGKGEEKGEGEKGEEEKGEKKGEEGIGGGAGEFSHPWRVGRRIVWWIRLQKGL